MWETLGARLGICQPGVKSLLRQLALCCLGPERGQRLLSQSSRRALEPKPCRIHPHCQLTAGWGEGPVAEGSRASREHFCPRPDCGPGLPNGPRGEGANTHPTPLHCHTCTKLSIVLHIHATVLPYIHTDTQSDPRLHSVTNTSSHSPDRAGSCWSLLGTGTEWPEAGCLGT